MSTAPVDQNATTWQDRLAATCRALNLYPTPIPQVVSDRRGGRTAWTAYITADGRQYSARNWYDGRYINDAKEDAAEVACTDILKRYDGDPNT